MGVSKRYIVTKDDISNAITYLEYERNKGFDVKPKKELTIEDMINVDKMVIINPSLIDTLVSKKCKRTLEKIIKMTSVIYNEDDEDEDNSGLDFILNEIKKFRDLIKNKYHEYMKEKEYKILLKKLEIIESEVKLRRLSLQIKADEKEKKEEKKKGKGR